jgi:cobalt-zinc-cadmium efflux system outer membrane protein
MKFIYSTLSLLLLAAGAFAAEAPPSKSVTLDELVAQALVDNPELKFYEAEISASRGERRSAGAWANPEVSSEIGRKRVKGDAVAEGTAWAVSAAQTFEWPGRVSLRKAIADRQVELAQAGFEQFKAALAAQVRQKGFALFAAQRREGAAEEVATRGEELVGTLVQREPAGVAPLLETRAIEASVIRLRREAIEASKEAQSALYELNALRGRPIAERLVLADVILAFADLPPVEELLRKAGRGNFELRQREIEFNQQGFKLRLAENEAWPSITLGPQFSSESAGRDKETVGGIGISIPLPLWNRNQGGVEAANARLIQAETSLKLMVRDIERRIREQVASYERVRKELTRLSPKVAEQLREAALLADRHYRLGAVPLATYLEVQQSYLEALAAIFSSQADALNARAEIDLLTGASIPPALRAGIQNHVESSTPVTISTTKTKSKIAK